MSQDQARMAAVDTALERIEPGMTIGLGSGRAVFALADAIASRWPTGPPVQAVVASTQTAERARAGGITLIDLDADTSLDFAFDGADEVGPNLALIKGGGAAQLREKLVIAAAQRVVIMAEDTKHVDRLGVTKPLPVEVVRFAWTTTRARLLPVTGEATLRRSADGTPVTTDEHDYILDVPVPDGDLRAFAATLKSTLGVIDHGLFLDEATEVILGHSDGSTTILERQLT